MNAAIIGKPRQKEEKNDEGLSSLLNRVFETDLCDRAGKHTGRERERQICDRRTQTHRDGKNERPVVYKLPPQLEVFMPNQVFLERL